MGFKDAGKPHYLGHRERLRRRFRDGGADPIPDYELLELILFRAVPHRDIKPLAKAILAQFGTFAEKMKCAGQALKTSSGAWRGGHHRDQARARSAAQADAGREG